MFLVSGCSVDLTQAFCSSGVLLEDTVQGQSIAADELEKEYFGASLFYL